MPRSVATYQRNQMTLLLNTQNSTEERLEQFGNALRRVITKHGIPGDSLHLALHPFPHEANDIRLLLRNTDPHTAAHLWGATGLLEPATPRRNSNEHLMMKTGTLHPSMGPTTPWHESYSG